MSDDSDKRTQKRDDNRAKDRKYVKDYKGKWSLKPSYTTSELTKVKGPQRDTRRKELEAEARAYALRQAAKPKKK